VVRLAAPLLVRPAQRLQQARPARSVYVRAFDEAALKETAALDELVDALLSAGSQQEVSPLRGISSCLLTASAQALQTRRYHRATSEEGCTFALYLCFPHAAQGMQPACRRHLIYVQAADASC
jgi:hypothetical protein